MSKKLFFVKVIILFIALIFISLFVFITFSIKNQIDIKEDLIVETTTKEKGKIVFDLTKSPREQKKQIRDNTEEYLKQVYDYIFEDKKFANCLGLNYISYNHLVDNFKSTDSLYSLLKDAPMTELIHKLFSENEKDFNKVPLSELPVTENYIMHHPKSLREEFSSYIKEDYTKPGRGKMYNMDYVYRFAYDYGVGYNKEKQEIIVKENKIISFECEDETGGSVWGKKGSKYEEQELYAHLKNIYFKYLLDDRGYIDDIWFDHIEVLASEEDLDNSVPNYLDFSSLSNDKN